MIKTKISKYFKNRNATDLIHMPYVITVNKFDEQSAKDFKEAFQKAVDVGQPIIPILIDSYGGAVYSLMSMVDTIRTSPVPVSTICLGKGMSCGAVLFTCGAEGRRYMAPHATLMIHDVSSFSFGKVKEMKQDVKEADRLNTLIYEMMETNCGLAKGYITDIVHGLGRADWYLTAEEAKKHKITNHVRIPQLEVKASVSVKLV
jgi:ATP-dependent Clp protease protease subunit